MKEEEEEEEETRLSHYLQYIEPSSSPSPIVPLLASGACMSCHAILAKQITEYPLFMIIGIRAFLILILLFGYFRYTGALVNTGSRSNKWIVIQMILTGILYSYVYLSAIDRLEVSEAVLMLNCAVLFNGLWGRVLNREVLRRKEIGGVMVVLVGVLMVVTPFQKGQSVQRVIGFGMGLVGAMIMSLNNARMRTTERMPDGQTLLVFSIIGQLVLSPGLCVLSGYEWPSLYQIMVICMMGISNCVGQVCLMYALQRGQTGHFYLLNYCQLILTLAYDLAVVGFPGGLEVLGYGLVLLGTLFIQRIKQMAM